MLFDFDDADEALSAIPVAAQRALDHAGKRLAPEAWSSLEVDDRRELVALGATPLVNAAAVEAVLSRATPAPKAMMRVPDPGPSRPSATLVTALAALGFTLDEPTWRGLRPLERYALAHAAQRPERLLRVAGEILAP